jgi:hypothetical protein
MTTDTTALDDPSLLEHCRDDAQKWAQAFNQHAVKLGYQEMDEGWLIAWFANAIESSHDLRTNRGPLCGDHAQYLLDKAESAS